MYGLLGNQGLYDEKLLVLPFTSRGGFHFRQLNSVHYFIFCRVAAKKAIAAKVLTVPKLKAGAALKSKPKVYSLKPIVHVIEKPVPVYHKVPVPKKVIVPKFYPVMKPIPVPKIIPVPFKVPVKKVIPKIVKIPKAIPIPKFMPVKKPVPIPIPYPVPKYHKVPIYKPAPYLKYIPVPIPKKVRLLSLYFY